MTNLGTWQKTGNSSGNDTIGRGVQHHRHGAGHLATVNVAAGTLNLAGDGADTFTSYHWCGHDPVWRRRRGRWMSIRAFTANAMFSAGTTTVNGTYNAASTTCQWRHGQPGRDDHRAWRDLDQFRHAQHQRRDDDGNEPDGVWRNTERAWGADGDGNDELLREQHATLAAVPTTSKIVAQSGASFVGGATLTLSAVTLELQNSSATTGSNNFNDVINLNNGALLQLDAGATFNDATTTGGANALLIQSTSGTAGSVTNLGTWEKTGNGSSIISVEFSNTGTINVQHGTLNLAGGLTSSGFVHIESGATLTINGVSNAFTITDGAQLELGGASAEQVTFATGNGTLDLNSPSSFSGKIAGITGSGDILDLGGFNSHAGDTFLTSTSIDGNGNTLLTVTNSTQGTSASVTLVGNYTSSTWTVGIDNNGGLDVADPPATNSITAG